MDIIKTFENEYFFLSNYYEIPVEYKGLHYLSSEAAYQAQKCISESEMHQFTTLTPDESKKLGKRIQIREDWNDVKVTIMREIVRNKFNQHEDLKKKLIATGNTILEEGNTWNDTFWGISLKTGIGCNHLGKILMDLRTEFINS